MSSGVSPNTGIQQAQCVTAMNDSTPEQAAAAGVERAPGPARALSASWIIPYLHRKLPKLQKKHLAAGLCSSIGIMERRSLVCDSEITAPSTENTIFLMARKNELSSKITKLTQVLIFHLLRLLLQPSIIYHSSHTFKILTNLNMYEKVRFLSRVSTPHKRVRSTQGIS